MSEQPDLFASRTDTTQRSVVLRDYQRESVESVFREWGEGQSSTLVCLPTGCGKSVVFSAVIKRWMEAQV